MTTCPHCDKELILAHGYAEGNVLTYGGTAKTATLCCGNMVEHSRVQYTVIRAARMPKDREDDWGYIAERPKGERAAQ
jgi:hypothetical protein